MNDTLNGGVSENIGTSNSATQTTSNNYQQTVKDMNAAGINPLALYKGATLDQDTTTTAQKTTTNTKASIGASIGMGLLAALCLL